MDTVWLLEAHCNSCSSLHMYTYNYVAKSESSKARDKYTSCPGACHLVMQSMNMKYMYLLDQQTCQNHVDSEAHASIYMYTCMYYRELYTCMANIRPWDHNTYCISIHSALTGHAGNLYKLRMPNRKGQVYTILVSRESYIFSAYVTIECPWRGKENTSGNFRPIFTCIRNSIMCRTWALHV